MKDTAKTSTQLFAQAALLRKKITRLEAELATVEQLISTTIQDPETQKVNRDSTVPSPLKQDVVISYNTLQRLIQQLPIGVQIFDTNGLCVDVNEAHMKIFGVDFPEQVIGKFNLFSDPLAKKIGTQAGALKALAGNVVRLPEIYFDFTHADSRYAATAGHCVLTITFFPVTNSKGKVLQIVALNEDITERKRTETELRLSDEILKQFPDAIIVANPDGRIERWQGMAKQIFGYTADEAKGNLVNFIDHPDNRTSITKEILESLAETGQFFGEVVCIRKDGTTVPVEVAAKTIYDTNNTPTGFISINRDITDRKEAEQAIQQAETNHRVLIEQLPAITYIVDFKKPTNKTTYISPQIETLLGVSQTEWLTDPTLWKRQLHPEDRAEVLAEIKRQDALGKGVDMEYRILTRDGRVLWVHNQSTTLEENGIPRYTHGLMFDITHQKQLEEQLGQAQKMEAVGQMAGGIAHNFNNVLTSLIGHTEFALDSLPQDHPVRYDLERISSSAQRAAGLTQQLLAFTRKQIANPHNLNLNQVVTDSKTMLRQLINKTIDLVVFPGENLCKVKVDPNQIEQVLINLLVNSQDAMPNGGKITITTTNVIVTALRTSQQTELPSGKYVLLSVSDTGTGIPEELQSHIFEPFFTTKEVGKGTGLGLSTCFGIIKQNKGYILVDSKPAFGTTFNIYFPCSYSVTDTVPMGEYKKETLPKRKATILLVEDTVMVREMSVRVLHRQGYHVLSAANGEDALKMINTLSDNPPQLLITDLIMPKIRGDTLADQIVEMHPATKVLFISGLSEKALERQGVLGSGYSVLSKPFTPTILLKKVSELIE